MCLNEWEWIYADSMQAWRCSRPYRRKPTAVRRSSRSKLDRKLLWSSASTTFPLSPPQPFRRTTADWHSSQSTSFLMPTPSWLARAFRPQRLRCSMLAATRALGRCRVTITCMSIVASKSWLIVNITRLLVILQLSNYHLISFPLCRAFYHLSAHCFWFTSTTLHTLSLLSSTQFSTGSCF